MSEKIVNETLKVAAKGTALSLIGMVFYVIFEFLCRVVVARSVTPFEYGLFCLGFVLLNVFSVFSYLGLESSAARCIAYFRGKKDGEKVVDIVSSAVQLSLIASVFCALLVFLYSGRIAQFFHTEGLAEILRIFAVAIPFSVMITVLSSIFRGFDSVKEKVFFRNILTNVLKLSSILVVVYMGFGILEITYAYALSIIVTALAFFAYSSRKLPFSFKVELRGKLLRFSLPLLTGDIFTLLIVWMDVLMLGYFKDASQVGVYNAAHSISHVIPVFLLSMNYIYVPIASRLYSRGLIDEMRKNYAVVTKWIYFAAFPLFLIVFLFPEIILKILFGTVYVQAHTALQILAFGMLINTFLGPNGPTLIALGKTKLHMSDNLIAVILNFILNVFLIPLLGITGAALASAASIIVANVLRSVQIYTSHEIHPFVGNYLKPLLVSAGFALAIYFVVVSSRVNVGIVSLVVIYLLFLACCVLSVLLTKSLDKEDLMLLSLLKGKK